MQERLNYAEVHDQYKSQKAEIESHFREYERSQKTVANSIYAIFPSHQIGVRARYHIRQHPMTKTFRHYRMMSVASIGLLFSFFLMLPLWLYLSSLIAGSIVGGFAVFVLAAAAIIMLFLYADQQGANVMRSIVEENQLDNTVNTGIYQETWKDDSKVFETLDTSKAQAAVADIFPAPYVPVLQKILQHAEKVSDISLSIPYQEQENIQRALTDGYQRLLKLSAFDPGLLSELKEVERSLSQLYQPRVERALAQSSV